MGIVLEIAGRTTAVLAIIILRPWLRRYALSRPNFRSSHREPTPQGGGIAVIAATIAAICGVFISSRRARPRRHNFMRSLRT